MTEVVAALIWEQTRFFICQRPANKSCPLLWEFPGGKVEPGETAQQALIRECREELGVPVEVGALFTEVCHTYPDITVHLSLFHAKFLSEQPKLLEHNDFRWITAEEIPNFPFFPSYKEILEKIVQYCKK